MKWDPQEYLRFADERGRPFRDLLDRVPVSDPRYVVDLGCGPGNLTATLANRWPGAEVVGVDSSAEMIRQAREQFGDSERLSFVEADLRGWRPARPVDVLISNATLQWVPWHLELLGDLAGLVRPRGWFAFQVPGNFGEPSHTELAAVRDSPRWRDRLGGVAVARPWVAEPATYLEQLAPLASTIDVWETTYVQVLQGEDAVLQWVRGTALRPVLSELDEAEQAEFLQEYGARLRAAYPQQAFGTVLPYRRIFAVAQIGTNDSDSEVVSAAGRLSGLHHVQLAAPRGSEPVLRHFYGTVLGMTELTKPPVLAARGGAWFRGGGVELHLGIEDDFRPARKAHPGILVADIDALVRRLEEHDIEVAWDDNFPGFRRCYVADPHGNRLELLQPRS